MSDEYQRTMKELGAQLDPKEWRPLTLDGRVIAYVKLPAECQPDERLADLIGDYGRERGQC